MEKYHKHEAATRTIDEMKVQQETINSLKLALQKARDSAVVLNQALLENKDNFKKEMEYIAYTHKKEVWSWKRDLGEARKNHIKLEKKFTTLQESVVYVKTNKAQNIGTIPSAISLKTKTRPVSSSNHNIVQTRYS